MISEESICNYIHYNEEDCVSTGDLRDFLLDKKPNDIPFFTPKLEDDKEE